MISALVKDGRLAKGYTQKELSELSNISVRSIQRIENGKIVPRSYTLRTLAEILGLPIESVRKTNPLPERGNTMNRGQKQILSAGVTLFILLGCAAFIAQSPTFPETTFELLVFSAVVLALITGFLTILWRTKR